MLTTKRYAELLNFFGKRYDAEHAKEGRTPSAQHWMITAGEMLLSQATRITELEAQLEIERMRVVACGVAAMGNTEKSKAERITKDNPYWTASYGDVCRAVDTEIDLRTQLADAKQVANDCRIVADNAIAEALVAKKPDCVWTYDIDQSMYDTSCSEAWRFDEGFLKDHSIKFCPFCAGHVKEST